MPPTDRARQRASAHWEMKWEMKWERNGGVRCVLCVLCVVCVVMMVVSIQIQIVDRRSQIKRSQRVPKTVSLTHEERHCTRGNATDRRVDDGGAVRQTDLPHALRNEQSAQRQARQKLGRALPVPEHEQRRSRQRHEVAVCRGQRAIIEKTPIKTPWSPVRTKVGDDALQERVEERGALLKRRLARQRHVHAQHGAAQAPQSGSSRGQMQCVCSVCSVCSGCSGCSGCSVCAVCEVIGAHVGAARGRESFRIRFTIASGAYDSRSRTWSKYTLIACAWEERSQLPKSKSLPFVFHLHRSRPRSLKFKIN